MSVGFRNLHRHRDIPLSHDGHWLRTTYSNSNVAERGRESRFVFARGKHLLEIACSNPGEENDHFKLAPVQPICKGECLPVLFDRDLAQRRSDKGLPVIDSNQFSDFFLPATFETQYASLKE